MNYKHHNRTIVQSRFITADELTESNAARFFTEKVFAIPTEFVEEYFDSYYLLYWRGDHTLAQMNAGTITHNDKRYTVAYKWPLTRGKILAMLDSQYALSFREAKPRYGINPMVIISFANKEQNHV